MGKPDAATCARLATKFDALYPHSDALVNRELVSLLIYLDSPTVVGKTVPFLSVSEPATLTPEQLGGAKLTARNDSYGSVVDSVGDSRPDRRGACSVHRRPAARSVAAASPDQLLKSTSWKRSRQLAFAIRHLTSHRHWVRGLSRQTRFVGPKWTNNWNMKKIAPPIDSQRRHGSNGRNQYAGAGVNTPAQVGLITSSVMGDLCQQYLLETGSNSARL